MVARAPNFEGDMRNITFKTDMMKVWGMISVLTRDLDWWTHVKSAQRTRNVRKAYRDLWDHFLLPNNVDNTASEAETLLVATHYYGERKRFNFERYAKTKRISTTSLKGSRKMGIRGSIPGTKSDI